MKLTLNDYKKILKYYNIPIKDNKSAKEQAEKILASKLCRCIKRVKSIRNTPETNAIAICRTSVFKRKNIDFNGFSCKKKQVLTKKYRTNQRLKKINYKKTKKQRKQRN